MFPIQISATTKVTKIYKSKWIKHFKKIRALYLLWIHVNTKALYITDMFESIIQSWQAHENGRIDIGDGGWGIHQWISHDELKSILVVRPWGFKCWQIDLYHKTSTASSACFKVVRPLKIRRGRIDRNNRVRQRCFYEIWIYHHGTHPQWKLQAFQEKKIHAVN